MIPQPVKAVILLFPTKEAEEAKYAGEESKTTVDPTMIWIKQDVLWANGCAGQFMTSFYRYIMLAVQLDYCIRW